MAEAAAATTTTTAPAAQAATTTAPAAPTTTTAPAETTVPAVTTTAAAPESLLAKPTDTPAAPAVAFDTAKLQLPEGWKADDDASKANIAKFGELINDTKLDGQARGQALFNLFTESVNRAVEAATAATTKSWTDTQDQWQKEIKADKDIGGDKLPATLQGIAKMIDTLGPDRAKGFREALAFTGAGNNPAVARALAHFASQLNEGGHVTGSPPSGSDKSVAEMFFPNSPGMK